MAKRKQSWCLAFCGLSAALSVVIMLLGNLSSLLLFIAPAVAGFLVEVVGIECGKRYAVAEYTAVSLLGIFFVPDKEFALLFACLLGYYPLVKPKLDGIRLALVRVAGKLLLCNGAVFVLYGTLYLLFPSQEMTEEFREASFFLLALTLAMGDVAFLLYDRLLVNLSAIYRKIWQPVIHRKTGYR